MYLAKVTWRDAYFDTDKEKKRKDYIVQTVGWVNSGKKFLTIRSEKLPDGWRAITNVPHEVVIRIDTLEEAKRAE